MMILKQCDRICHSPFDQKPIDLCLNEVKACKTQVLVDKLLKYTKQSIPKNKYLVKIRYTFIKL